MCLGVSTSGRETLAGCVFLSVDSWMGLRHWRWNLFVCSSSGIRSPERHSSQWDKHLCWDNFRDRDVHHRRHPAGSSGQSSSWLTPECCRWHLLELDWFSCCFKPPVQQPAEHLFLFCCSQRFGFTHSFFYHLFSLFYEKSRLVTIFPPLQTCELWPACK